MPSRGSGKAYQEDIILSRQVVNADGNSGLLDGFEESTSLIIHTRVYGFTGTGTPAIQVSVRDTLNGVDFSTVASDSVRSTTGIHSFRVNSTNPFSGRLRIDWAITGTTPTVDVEIRMASQSALT